MAKAIGTVLGGIAKSPIPSASEREAKPKEATRLYYSRADDLKVLLRRTGFSEDVAGADYGKLVTAAARAFSVFEPRKAGMIITGDYGCGKTYFIRCLRFPCAFIDLTLTESIDRIDQHCVGSLNDICEGSVVLDDIGAESLRNEYGIKRDVVGEFICRYHSRGKGRLFITTNLSGNELLDRYGGRVFDRIKQMCVPVHMDGTTKRKWVQ